MIHKACPVVIRVHKDPVEAWPRPYLLVFRHPLAGIQFVKGGIKRGETCAQAASRELFEESGLVATSSQHLGDWISGYKGQTWSFHLMACQAQALPETWDHYTTDGGGQVFSFFWHPLHDPATNEWHQVFVDALEMIRSRH